MYGLAGGRRRSLFAECLANLGRNEVADGFSNGARESFNLRAQVREFLDDRGVIGGHFGSENCDVRLEIGNIALAQPRQAVDALVDASDFCFEATDALLVRLSGHWHNHAAESYCCHLEADTF
jgi:hypothetical protein